MAGNNKRLFLRSQRMKETLSEDKDESAAETQLLQTVHTKVDFPSAPNINDKSKNTSETVATTDETQFKVENENGICTANKVIPISKEKSRSARLNPGTALSKFRQAGVKAKLVSRMERIVEDRMSAKQIFNRFVNVSTLHGFRFIFTKTFYIRRFIWLVITLFMSGLFLKEVKNSITLYYEYPFTTTSIIDYVNDMTFPAISFCNLNHFRRSKLINNTQLHEYFANNTNNWTYSSSDMDGDKFGDSMKVASHDIKDMFKKCEWIKRDSAMNRTNPCNYTNFTKYYDTNGQTCFTFNSGKAGHPLLKQNQTGLTFHAFDLILTLESHEYLQVVQEAGVRVVVHDQGETPLDTAGFVAAPGVQTFVEIKLQQVENLPPPYATHCGSRPLVYFVDTGYRKSKCFLDRLTKNIIKHCGCRGLFMPESTGVPLCSLRKTVKCLNPAIANFENKSNDVCPEDCNSINFVRQLSYARFVNRPPPEGDKTFLDDIKPKLNRSERENYIRDNIVSFKFFYQDLKIENIKQKASYNFYKLVGDVGGQLGLMLGASVLTLVEFVDLIAFMFYHQMLRLSRNRKKEQMDKMTKHDEDGLNINNGFKVKKRPLAGTRL